MRLAAQILHYLLLQLRNPGPQHHLPKAVREVKPDHLTARQVRFLLLMLLSWAIYPQLSLFSLPS